ncbi:uncharacterized protein LOC122856195 [Aphidius gifuensis]|nr:uncharacterized protein LOC122856195 [Aphidius gifuensis]
MHCENGYIDIAQCKIPTSYNIITNYEVRWVSLAPVIATPNYTVTGIRWRFINRMLYLEIQEAVYIDDWTVDKETVRWKPTIEHGTDETAIPIDAGIVNGFGLSGVTLPSGYLLTGVQFDWNQEEYSSISTARVFRINVRGTLFGEDDEDNNDSSIWKVVEWDHFQNKIELEEPDRSEYATNNNEILSKNGDYIYFQQTDIIKDAAQTSVPYLDIQSVTIDIPVPLGGIGVYYRGQKGYGGFIALRTFIPECDEIIDEKRLEVYTKATSIILKKLHDPKFTNMTAMEFIDSLDIAEE